MLYQKSGPWTCFQAMLPTDAFPLPQAWACDAHSVSAPPRAGHWPLFRALLSPYLHAPEAACRTLLLLPHEHSALQLCCAGSILFWFIFWLCLRCGHRMQRSCWSPTPLASLALPCVHTPHPANTPDKRLMGMCASACGVRSMATWRRPTLSERATWCTRTARRSLASPSFSRDFPGFTASIHRLRIYRRVSTGSCRKPR